MQFPNAHKGVSQIFTAEILTLIAGILGIIAAVSAAVAVAASEAEAGDAAIGGFALGAGGLALVAGVLAIIGFILTILGITKASKDEATFKSALLWLILGIVGGVVQSMGQSGDFVPLIGSLLSSLGSMLSTYYVILGIIKLADRKRDAAVSAKGNRLIKIILAIYILALILTVVDGFAGGTDGGVVAGGVVGVISLILLIVAYVLYLTLLSQAKKMLAN